jgi:DNA-binding MarR family transcriptional regulator
MKTNKDALLPENIEEEIFSFLRRIINAVEIYASKVKDLTSLNASQLSCLLVLDKIGAISLSKLSKKVSLSPSMITSIVDQLEKKKLVKRSRRASDRRVILIELTDSGKDTAAKAPPSFQEQFMNGLSYLDTENKEHLYYSLSKLLDVIVSEVLIDSALLGGENKLVGVEPSVLEPDEVAPE